ncbi:unnamed protein product [Closterium sp. NIES-53]
MTLRPSFVPLRVPLFAPPESSLPDVPDLESDRARAASPTVSRLLASTVTDPSFEYAAASALVGELLDFAVVCRLDYTTALVAKSASASPLSVGGKCALSTDVLEDKREDFECLAAAVPLESPAASLRSPPGASRVAQLRTTLAALGFAPDTVEQSLFLRTDTSLPPFYVLVYVNDLVFATADTEALTLVKSELQKRQTCTDLGPSALRLPVLLVKAHSSVYQPLALSSTSGRVRRAEWSVPRACGLAHVPDDVHTT